MKKLISLVFLVLSPMIVAADTGMMGYGMMGSGLIGFLWWIYFALAAFIFSIIFWLTHNWLVKDKKKRR